MELEVPLLSDRIVAMEWQGSVQSLQPEATPRQELPGDINSQRQCEAEASSFGQK